LFNDEISSLQTNSFGDGHASTQSFSSACDVWKIIEYQCEPNKKVNKAARSKKKPEISISKNLNIFKIM
jgi:hypothetical protein